MESEVIRRSNLSVVDDIGSVYIGEKYVYRAINSQYIHEIKQLLECGLIQELTSKKLFPKTEISDFRIAGCELVLQHEKISRIVYPFEWSPEMLRKAALCVLDVNECANKYGYELKDAHPFNVLFKYSNPMYVDFGSLVKRKSPNAWLARAEFDNCYTNNLLLVENKFLSLYKNAFHIKGTGFDSTDILRINSKIYNILGENKSKKIIKLFNLYRDGIFISKSKIEDQFKNIFIRKIIKFFLWSTILPFRKISLTNIRSKIIDINLSHGSQWANYHSTSNYLDNTGAIKLPSRMDWVIEQVKSLNVKTVTELAGNEGVLSRRISEISIIEEVICTDYDQNAIDSLLLNLKEDKVYIGCFDFINEIHEEICPNRFNRLNSEMVIALAVTHHLVLTQKYSLDHIFKVISSYTTRYIIIEFMPLGLWNGDFSPEVPIWYTEEWFITSMQNFYKILKRERLEDNRIAFVGELLNNGSKI